jgi:hypothetical protein
VIPDSTSLSITGNYAMGLWVYLTANPVNNDLIAFFDKDNTGVAGYGMDYFQNATVFQIRAYHVASSTYYIYSTNKVIPLNTWNHIIMTYDGANQNLYFNGVRIGGQAQTTNPADNAENLNIGCAGNGTTKFITGLIDEVIIESRAWTAAEVSTYYRKSMLNYRQRSFGAIIAMVLTALKGTFTLTGKNTTYNTTLKANKSSFSLLGKIVNFILTGTSWSNQTKNTSTWTNKDKNSSTWTNRNKS